MNKIITMFNTLFTFHILSSYQVNYSNPFYLQSVGTKCTLNIFVNFVLLYRII
jgi:hypothetical protein